MAARFFAADVVYEDDPAWPDHQTARGRDAFVERFDDFLDAWGGEYEFEVERVEAAGEKVASIVVLRTKGTSSGVRQSHRWGLVFELRDGLVIWLRPYVDANEALGALEGPER